MAADIVPTDGANLLRPNPIDAMDWAWNEYRALLNYVRPSAAGLKDDLHSKS